MTPGANRNCAGVVSVHKEAVLARENYAYIKKQKELANKKKKEERMQSKLAKKNAQANDGLEKGGI